MCGRYAFFAPADAVQRWFGVPFAPGLAARYNIAPTQDVPVLREREAGHREVALLRWGLVPSWAGDPSIGQRMINARAETLAVKPSFRAAFRRRRCVVLASGWYEWQKTATGKQPFFLHRRDGEPLGFAGLWEQWVDRGSGEAIQSCAIVTTAAPPALADIHDRMPAVLAREALAEWLDPMVTDGARLSPLLGAGEAASIEARPVSRAVNDARNEGPQLVEPLAGAR
ncbi:MAG: SOS response-associated peptidase [Steroidobacteraceae bacterium]|jgi:putative SOS response-associated peptidase YedK|nr:SOS response-associated peptidase [Steroidobacteraceae bacterium]